MSLHHPSPIHSALCGNGYRTKTTHIPRRASTMNYRCLDAYLPDNSSTSLGRSDHQGPNCSCWTFFVTRGCKPWGSLSAPFIDEAYIKVLFLNMGQEEERYDDSEEAVGQTRRAENRPYGPFSETCWTDTLDLSPNFCSYPVCHSSGTLCVGEDH